MTKHIIFSLVIIFCSYTFSQDKNYEKGLLWEISGNGLQKPSYIFGTFHSSMEEYFELSDSVFYAIESVESFAGELNMDSLQYYVLKIASRKENGDITKILSKEQLDLLNKKLKEKLGVELDDLPSKDPVVISLALQGDEFKGNMPFTLDEYLYKIAKTNNKKILGVENFDLQLNLLESLSAQEIKDMLIEAIDDDELKQNMIDELITAYKEQDLQKIDKFLNQSLDEGLNQKFLVQRNLKMAEKISSTIKEGSLFTAVGAAHLPGDRGLINLLEEMGYSLRAVTISNTGLYKKYKEKILGQPWFIFSPPSGGFSIEMPGETMSIPIPNKIPGVNIESGFFSELVTGTTYMAIKMIYPLRIENARKDSVFNTLINNILESGSSLDGEIEDIVVNSLSGKEFKIKTNDYISRSRMFIRDNNLYWFQFVYADYETVADKLERFFNSFKVQEEKVIESKKINFVSDKGAFKIDFDNEPFYQEINENDNMLYMFTSSDKSNESFYIVMYTNNNFSYYYNDSASISYRINNIAANKNGEVSYFIKRNFDFPAFDFRIVLEDGILSGRAVQRGNRFYLIANSCFTEGYDSLRTENLLSTFELTDYLPLEWKEYKDDENNFSVSLPDKPNVSKDSTAYEYNQVKTFSSLDSTSGIPFNIYKFKLSKYYQSQNDSALFSIFLAQYFDTSEIFIQKDTLIGSLKIRDRIFKPLKSQNYYRHRVIINGSSVYKFEVIAPENFIYSKRVEPFFNSINIFENNSNDIYSDKTGLLFNDLESDDTLTTQSAAAFCSYFSFNEEHLDKIKFLLKKNLPDDKSETGVRRSLLNSLSEIETDEKLNVVTEAYPYFDGEPLLQKAALEVISSVNTKESTELFLQYILTDTSHSDDYSYFLFYPFYDSLNNLSLLFPRILNLLNDDEYKESIYGLLSTGIDSMVLDPSQYIAYEDSFIEDARNLISQKDSLLKEDEEYTFTWKMKDLLTVIGELKENPQAIEILKTQVEGDIPVLALNAVVSLLKIGENASPEAIKKIAADVNVRNDFYLKLSKLSKNNLYPEEYYTPLHFAEGDLSKWLYEDDYEYIDTLIYIDERETEEGKIYMFKFNFEYDTENYYVGISGPFSLDENFVTAEPRKKTKSNYSYLDNKSLEEHWIELLKE